MVIKIERTVNGYECSIDGKVITTQHSLVKLFYKMWKYSKGANI